MNDYWDTNENRIRQIEQSWILNGGISGLERQQLSSEERTSPDARSRRLCSILLRLSAPSYSPTGESDPQALALLKKRHSECLKQLVIESSGPELPPMSGRHDR